MVEFYVLTNEYEEPQMDNIKIDKKDGRNIFFNPKLDYLQTVLVNETQIEVYLDKRTHKKMFFKLGEKFVYNNEVYWKLIPLNAEEFSEFGIPEKFEETLNCLRFEETVEEESEPIEEVEKKPQKQPKKEEEPEKQKIEGEVLTIILEGENNGEKE